MTERLSSRLHTAVEALPLRSGMRVLEIGCGTGAAARAVAERIVPGLVVAIDRSDAAVRQAIAGSAAQIAAEAIEVRKSAIEEFVLAPGEAPFDLVFGFRVGALDGRHPELFERAMRRIREATRPGARIFIDGGDPLRELPR